MEPAQSEAADLAKHPLLKDEGKLDWLANTNTMNPFLKGKCNEFERLAHYNQ